MKLSKNLMLTLALALSTLITTTTSAATSPSSQVQQVKSTYKQVQRPQNLVKLNPTIFLDGVEQEINEKFLVANNRTYLPLKAVADILGAEISFNNTNKIVTVKSKKKTIEIPLGYNVAVINGQNIVKIDSSNSTAFIYNSKIYVPIRFISEQLGVPLNYGDGIIDFGKRVHITELQVKRARIFPHIEKYLGLTGKQIYEKTNVPLAFLWFDLYEAKIAPKFSVLAYGAAYGEANVNNLTITRIDGALADLVLGAGYNQSLNQLLQLLSRGGAPATYEYVETYANGGIGPYYHIHIEFDNDRNGKLDTALDISVDSPYTTNIDGDAYTNVRRPIE